MRRNVRLSKLALPVAALALSALPARAEKDLGAIKREVWSTELGIERARADLRGLYAIVGDTQAYNPPLATQIRDRLAQDLQESEHCLGRLWSVSGQDDATMRQVASLQDSVRKLRQRVLRLGHETRAQVANRPDTRQGASGGPVPSAHAHAKSESVEMPPLGSEALLDTRADLKGAWGELDSVESAVKKLAERYQVADHLPSP